MWAFLRTAALLARGRWRRLRGRCPQCGRRLQAPFAYYMTAYPNCSVCKDETQSNGRLWHAYRALGASNGFSGAGLKESAATRRSS
ncbi:MAG TPA: hypothetical protein VFA18_02695 [Gemmataceae bacterium]|nr:hypothetical protein [Gemmataceae bacterium]